MKLAQLAPVLIVAALSASPAQAKNDKHSQLPPGLQKNVANGKPIPPGWQKKLSRGQVIDRDTYEHSTIVKPVDSKGLITLRIEGKLVKLYAATREVAEVLND